MRRNEFVCPAGSFVSFLYDVLVGWWVSGKKGKIHSLSFLILKRVLLLYIYNIENLIPNTKSDKQPYYIKRFRRSPT